MGKVTTWESLINDKNYTFSYEKVKGKNNITVNGETILVKSTFMSSMLGFDEPFFFDGLAARLIVEKNRPDVVVNGVYLQSGKQYRARPAWVLAFAILCIIIPIISLGGLIPFLLGFGGLALCVAVSKTNTATALRVLLCIIITVAAWALWFFMILGTIMLSM